MVKKLQGNVNAAKLQNPNDDSVRTHIKRVEEWIETSQ